MNLNQYTKKLLAERHFEIERALIETLERLLGRVPSDSDVAQICISEEVRGERKITYFYESERLFTIELDRDKEQFITEMFI